MLGAIAGDIIGSPYEFDSNNIKTTDFPLFSERSRFTDDTVMTAAVAEALMDRTIASARTRDRIFLLMIFPPNLCLTFDYLKPKNM